MKAVVRDRYGKPEVLRVDDIDPPQLEEHHVLVRVRAVSLNLSDWECLVGSPLYSRIGGLRRAHERRDLVIRAQSGIEHGGADVSCRAGQKYAHTSEYLTRFL